MPDRGLWPADPKDRLRIREAAAAGAPFLVLRDDAGAQRIVVLADDRGPAIIGRSPDSDVPIEWDDRVSRTHAQLTRIGWRWHVEDEGLSRNGTFVNEQRVHGRRVLQDGDVLRVGHTMIVFHAPGAAGRASPPTAPESRLAEPPPLSPSQRRVLAALCRPCLLPGGPHPPATNEQIAAELHLSTDAVKGHLRQLFRRFDIEQLPQIQKRTALVRIAIEAGILRSS
jgi:pSer/pThr/pTyr-binding forkhead associated (FHA) protein